MVELTKSKQWLFSLPVALSLVLVLSACGKIDDAMNEPEADMPDDSALNSSDAFELSDPQVPLVVMEDVKEMDSLILDVDLDSYGTDELEGIVEAE